MADKGIRLISAGSYHPSGKLTNEDFTKFLDTSDEWITSRTGIKERQIATFEPTWYMGAEAAKNALKHAGLSADELGLIICTTVTPDFFTPSTSCLIQGAIGASRAFCFDMNAACSGFVYALDAAYRYLYSDDSIKYAMVISSETLSKITDYEDRSTCVLFGDGAGAVILAKGEGRYGSYLMSDGSRASCLFARTIPLENPLAEPKENFEGFADSRKHYLYMEGHEVYKFAVRAMPEALRQASAKAGIDPSELDLVVPHQANIRIIRTASKELGIPMDKMYVNLDRRGNTSSSCIPVCIDELMSSGSLREGMKLCLVGFGAGLTSASAVFDLKF